MKKEVVIDGNRITDKSSLYEEINRQFMENEDWQLGESLDALDDLLYGGFGILKENEEVRLVWKNFEENKYLFGHEFTKEFYAQKLEYPEDYNSDIIQKKLDELNSGQGQTYFDIILEIINEHKNIELVKK